MKRGVLTAILFFIIFPLSAQVELELHGSAETLHALSLSKPGSADLGLTDSRSSFTGEVSAYAGQASAFVSLSAEYNAVSPDDRTGFSLGEAWMDWSAGGFQLRLGRQLLSWGAADGLILTDVVCPQNLSAYAGLDFAGSRLPVDGLKLGYSFQSFAAEAVWLPLFTPARLPGRENPLYRVLYPESIERGGTVLPVNIGDAVLPRTIADGEYGLRLSAYTPALDFSVMAFYGWNDTPYAEKTIVFSEASVPAGLELLPEYDRTITAGTDASVPLGEVLLRMEAAWTGGGRYDRSAAETAAAFSAGQNDSPVEKHRLKLLAGLDWNPPGWTLFAQYYEDLLPDAYDGGTARAWRKNALTLRIAKAFFRKTLNLSAWCYLDLHDFDTAGSVSAAYALTDNLEFSLGSDFFTGGIDGRGTYAAYKDLSCVWVKGIFRF
jgi:hypothetical protein